MMSGPDTSRAESLKMQGNELFSQGNLAGAVASYQAALEAMNIGGELVELPSPRHRPLCAVLYSNLSHALAESGMLDSAVTAAKRSTTCDPALKKGWARLVRSLHLARRSFEAFVIIHAQLSEGLTQREVHALCGPTADAVAETIGVTNLHHGFGLRQDANGVYTVAVDKVPCGKELFVERQWENAFLTAVAPSEASSVVSNESLLRSFARQLVTLCSKAAAESADEKGQQRRFTDEWHAVCNALAGSWPRRPDEIPPPQRDLASAVVREVLQGVEGAPTGGRSPRPFELTEAEMDQIVHMSLVCRYNCFHSGFFRACALLNHSCEPNAAMKFVARERCVHMLVVSPIEKGAEVSVKYLSDADYLEGVGRRRELLFNSWLFWCSCKRCVRDSLESSTCEMRRCCATGCDAYVHCPTPGEADTASSPDPMTPAGRICGACGTANNWTKEERQAIYRARTEAASMHGSIQELSVTLVQLRSAVSAFVHPEHWIHRVLLYYFCVHATQIIARWFQALAEHQLQVPDIAPVALRQFGADCEQSNGGDLLVCLTDLWRRIQPFYPWNEGWALHCAIVRLVVINLCCATPALTRPPASMLPEDRCMDLLAIHAPYIGPQEHTACLKVVQSHRASDAASARLVKRLKKFLV